jgi:cyclic beta-1,2-glucan synthetase
MVSIRKWFRHQPVRHPLRGAELPLRAALFSTEQMKHHGKTLAGQHQVGRRGSPAQLLQRLEDNESVLTEVYQLLTAAVQTRRRIAPAGEWLLDNFYLIEEQIATAQRYLPSAYIRELPRLMDGPCAGLPRVYDIALEIVSHSDGQLHMEALCGFVGAYQTTTILKLGELWAIPIMLRLALIENLRRVGATMVVGTIDRISADYWADRLTKVAEEKPARLVTVVGDMVRSIPAMSGSFVAEFARRLQGKSSALGLPVRWVEQQLYESGLIMADVVQSEIQQQAADQVSIRNSITSLRLLDKEDWREFVESTSIVEGILRQDPARVYAEMDFETRDQYRHLVEDAAKRRGVSEEAVATEAVKKAGAATSVASSSSRTRHVGFYLARWKPRRLPSVLYGGSIALITVIMTAFLLWKTQFAGGLPNLATDSDIALGLLAAFCSIQLGINLVNWMATLALEPERLPRMDYSSGIPSDSRTLAVIPTLLTDAVQIEHLIEGLEVRFLANRDENLFFALLTDFQDAPSPEMPRDEELLRLTQAKINDLNNRYGGTQKGPFFLFHRTRQWNPRQGVWMGFERKRGKLEDLNRVLQGGTTAPFSHIVGQTAIFPTIRYVITLDTDTELPRGAARQMVGTMTHPLNRPRYEEKAGRVVEGYGILQPRVDLSLPATNRSRYARLFGSESGIDPYTRTVSDVYQDVFGEGSFIGKGIYDVEAFGNCLHQRLPNDLILSHDLLEGCYARAGLLSDVALYEDGPSNYLADANRRHRWIRGDWQIAQWILPWVPSCGGRSHSNPTSILSRWKILDNLRRSLVPAALTLLLIFAWTTLSRAWLWTLAVAVIVFSPALLSSVMDLLRKPNDVALRTHIGNSLRATGKHFLQAAFSFACLPYEAFYSLDAILRTALRVLVTRRRLLEWNTSDSANRRLGLGLAFFLRTMWIGPVVAIVVAAGLDFERRGIPVALAPVCLWFISPVAAWWMSQPRTRPAPQLTDPQREFLHALSRKTWKFFENFVGAEDNWLPPDNYQERPVVRISHRTSPTNMGLALLANLAAYDFGYITLDRLIERTTNALDTMEKLERYSGHFYNWYDTQTLKPLYPLYVSTVDSGNLAAHMLTLRQGLLSLPGNPLPDVIPALARRLGALTELDYDFLLDKTSHLLSIGYNVSERKLDTSNYDLLASEARLAAFLGIAQGRIPDESWFALGRRLTSSGGDPVLLSWSGSMFEYLMPLLIMPTFEHTLLDDTYKAAVKRQVAYGRRSRTPWGISECGYNTVDAHLNYQYRAFGVPGLGFKRGLAGDLVIAPYASALALMVSPEEACDNLQRISAAGFEGDYGMYEAIDYTPARVPPGERYAVVRSYMAHHQGMSFLALAYLLLDRPMQKRFTSDLAIQATSLLLHERVPKTALDYVHTSESSKPQTQDSDRDRPVRTFHTPDTPVPEVQLLSNGSYHVMLTNAGGGYSRWKDIAVTRWREDTSCDNFGSFCYIRDAISGAVWSTAHQPTTKPADAYEATLSEGRVDFRRRDYGIETRTEVAVSPEDDIELRRVRITNSSRRTRVIDVTSYAEVVLAPAAADQLHPAFSNLFVQTEIIPDRGTILCTRRPRSAGDPTPWMFHLVVVQGETAGEPSFETDRARFIGRGQTCADPLANSTALSGTAGSVLDPVVAIRNRVALRPEETAILNVVTGVAESRDACVALAAKYEDARFGDRVFDLAWTHAQVVLRQINATASDAQLYGRIAGSVIYSNASLRADPATLIRNRRPQSGLWAYSISGDLPIVLLRISDASRLDIVRQMVHAHAYWRMKGLAVDLVIWNEDLSGYRQPLHDEIIGMIATGIGAKSMNQPGGILVRFADQISAEDRILLQTVARVLISDEAGPLSDQLDNRRNFDLPKVNIPQLRPIRNRSRETAPVTTPPNQDLLFFNGHGGFTSDGREYVVTTTADQRTPAPWVNVLANASFGTVVSEAGTANTWSENAHEFRLTPWKNDPVCDSGGEAFYIRDEETGYFWSPTNLPRPGATPYVTRHGFGYTVFEHLEEGIHSELCTYVAIDAPVKLSVIRIRNVSGRSRRLSVTGYVEWVLSDLRARSAMHLVTTTDSSGAVFVRNPYSSDFADRIAFFDVDDSTRNVCSDRTEFLGRNGSPANPAAMLQARLSGSTGAGLDPCTAIQVSFDVADGQEREVVFTLGAGRETEATRKLLFRFRGSEAARHALEEVRAYWNRTLGTLHLETPDAALNLLGNGWLLYQTLASRLWARSGYYQPGGAFGFRDQLQDTMALIHAEPMLVRKHLLRCAAHQFPEGDVQHWWHPPSNRGVRTHCSDDFLWLAVATCRYVMATGDKGVLDESVHYIDGRAVKPGEDSYYDLPEQSQVTATLYEHCSQAILRGLQFGEHGLPLMGSGDWNDGMNLVGIQGKGESVWLGFFLYRVLMDFAGLATLHGDGTFAERCRSEAVQLRENIEKNAWDGEWYLRAYFDDGKPLGSSTSEECQIDSIAQSWSVLSGIGNAERSRQAMRELDRRLVRRTDALIQLLDPPFDKSHMDPGYIKGYVPGVRENGGQYTHAAIWAAMAFAELKDSEKAWELWSMIQPIRHGGSKESIAVYKVEPYVVAADLYSVPPHTGRGGWTWYTGSSGWIYRFITESLLGIQRKLDKLYFAPCIPAEWKSFKVDYRYYETTYHIEIRHAVSGSMKTSITVDGMIQPQPFLVLVNDFRDHWAEVLLETTPESVSAPESVASSSA